MSTDSVLIPYLFFNGNCREAMSFYKKVLGGDLTLSTYGETQGEGCPLGAKEKIIHGTLKNGNLSLMASDTPEESPIQGNNIQLSLNCESLTKIESHFKLLSEGGEVLLALHDAFWGARFGMLIDRYGIYWMLSHELKKNKNS